VPRRPPFGATATTVGSMSADPVTIGSSPIGSALHLM